MRNVITRIGILALATGAVVFAPSIAEAQNPQSSVEISVTPPAPVPPLQVNIGTTTPRPLCILCWPTD